MIEQTSVDPRYLAELHAENDALRESVRKLTARVDELLASNTELELRRRAEVSAARDRVEADVAVAAYRATNAALVLDMHEALGLPSPLTPVVPPVDRVRLRVKLVLEEAFEFAKAALSAPGGRPYLSFDSVMSQALALAGEMFPSDDVVPVLHELCDVDVVVAGSFLEYGVRRPRDLFLEVHAANMRKAGGPRREDGKVLKPPGWTPADIAPALRRMGWEG